MCWKYKFVTFGITSKVPYQHHHIVNSIILKIETKMFFLFVLTGCRQVNTHFVTFFFILKIMQLRNGFESYWIISSVCVCTWLLSLVCFFGRVSFGCV